MADKNPLGDSPLGGNSSDKTSCTLLYRLRQQPDSAAAWGEFDRRYRPMIRRWCRKWGLNQEDSDDLTQDVMVKLSREMERFEYDPALKFRSWLKTVTHRTLLDLAKRRHRVVGSGDSQVLDLLHSIEAREDLERRLDRVYDLDLRDIAMNRVRERVDNQTWEAFRLTALEGLSGAEAAEKLGMKVANIAAAKYRVTERLKSEIRDLRKSESNYI